MKQAEECISRKVVPTEHKEEHAQQNVSTKPSQAPRRATRATANLSFRVQSHVFSRLERDRLPVSGAG